MHCLVRFAFQIEQFDLNCKNHSTTITTAASCDKKTWRDILTQSFIAIFHKSFKRKANVCHLGRNHWKTQIILQSLQASLSAKEHFGRNKIHLA